MPTVNPQHVDTSEFIEAVRKALYASKIVAYAQGFAQIRSASEENDWEIDLGRDGDDLARGMHHPRALPGPDQRGL